MLKTPFVPQKNFFRKKQTGAEVGVDVRYEIAFKSPATMILFNPRTGIMWDASETMNLKEIRVLVYSDQQEDWVKRTNGIPVKAIRKPLPEVPKVRPKVHFFEVVESTQDKTKSEALEQGVLQ
jgi:hypothetical protein